MTTHVLVFEHDGGTDWLVGTDLTRMRKHLQEIGGTEIDEVDLEDVLDEQYQGLALLTMP